MIIDVLIGLLEHVVTNLVYVAFIELLNLIFHLNLITGRPQVDFFDFQAFFFHSIQRF